MGQGFTLSESISNALGQIGITVPGLGVPGSGGRGTFTSPRAPAPLTPTEQQEYNQKYFELQLKPFHLQPEKLDQRLVPINLARLNADLVDEEDVIDVPTPVAALFGFNPATTASPFGTTSFFGFTFDNNEPSTSPVFGWIDPSNITAGHPGDAPPGGAVPGAPGQEGTSAAPSAPGPTGGGGTSAGDETGLE